MDTKDNYKNDYGISVKNAEMYGTEHEGVVRFTYEGEDYKYVGTWADWGTDDKYLNKEGVEVNSLFGDNYDAHSFINDLAFEAPHFLSKQSDKIIAELKGALETIREKIGESIDGDAEDVLPQTFDYLDRLIGDGANTKDIYYTENN